MFGQWQEKLDEAMALVRELIDTLREHTAELKRHRERT